MVSFPSRTSLVSVRSAGSSSSSSSKVKVKEPKWRAPGRGGSGSVARKKQQQQQPARVDGEHEHEAGAAMHIPRGREVPLQTSGHSYSGRGGAGNAQGHYLDPRVFERVLEHEKGLVQAHRSGAEPVIKSGRGGIGNILPHRPLNKDKAKRASSSFTTATSTPALTFDDGFSPRNSLASIAESAAPPSTMYGRKRSLSVGSTVSSSSAYTGLHDQPPSSIPAQYLLGRRLRPSPSLDSASSGSEPSSAASTSNHHLSYLEKELEHDDHPTPRPASPVLSPPSPTLAPATPSSLLMRRGGSHPGLRRPQPAETYIPLQTLGLLRPPRADDADSIMSDAASRLSLSEFPLPPPSDRGYAPPPSAPATQTSFSALGAPPRRVIPDPPQKPPPSGPLPVPPRLPPPTGPLPPVPVSALPAPPAGSSLNDTIRAPQPKARPSLVGRMPSSSFLSVSGPAASPSPGSRPPPSPSSYFRRRPSTAPIAPIHSLPSVAPSLSPVPSVSPPPSASSQASSFHVPRSATSPPGFAGVASAPALASSTISRGRASSSVPPREVYTPDAAPEKTAALVRALSLDTSLDNPAASSLDMNDSDSGSGSSGDRSGFPRSAASEPQISLSKKPFTHSPPSSLASVSPPTSPSPSLTSFLEDGGSGSRTKRKMTASPNSSDESLMKTKLALAALRNRAKVDNGLMFQRSALGTTTLRL